MENKNNIIEIKKELLKDPKLRVFSKLNEGAISYLISLDSKEDSTDNSERVVLGTFNKGNPKDVKRKCTQLLEIISERNINKRKVESITTLLEKKYGVELSSEYKDIILGMTDKNKDEEIDYLSLERKIKLEEVFGTSEIHVEDTIDYNKLDEVLLKVDDSKIPDSYTEELVQEAGKKANNRLTDLESIKSKDDAELHEGSLVSFMTYREEETNRERILSNYMEKIHDLDPKTIIECLKVMEDETHNEDSKLYSIYLRIQENRVIKKVQEYLNGLKNQNEIPHEKAEKFLQVLDTQKTPIIENGTLHENILNAMDNKNTRFEEYLKEGRKTDIDILHYLGEINREDPEKDEVMQYLKCRVSSIGQVIKRDNHDLELRTYIEETTFKDDDETEQNWYLFEVAKVETNYLKTKYGKLLARHKDRQESNKSLSEYEAELSSLEQKKKDAKELFNQYHELNGKGESEKNEQ